MPQANDAPPRLRTRALDVKRANLLAEQDAEQPDERDDGRREEQADSYIFGELPQCKEAEVRRAAVEAAASRVGEPRHG